MTFPTTLDDNTSLPVKVDGDTIFAAEDNAENVALKALEAKVGIDSSAVNTSHDYKFSHLAAVANSASAADLSAGTLSAARLPALTGDVTTSAGSAATTLAAGSAANLNSGTLPAARLPAMTGDVTASAGTHATTLAAGSASNLNSGTLPAARMPALTGEVTTSAGAVAATVRATHTGSAHSGPTVKDLAYGALGNNSADDGTAINAAIAAQSAGGAIIVPAGTYLTSIPIVGKAGVSIIGIGRPIIRANSSFTQDATNKCLLDMYDKCDPAADITGLALDGNKKADHVVLAGNKTGTAQAKLYIHHNVIGGGNRSGVAVGIPAAGGAGDRVGSSSSNVVIHHNDFVNPTGWAGYLANLYTPVVTTIGDSWIYDNIMEVTGGSYSIEIYGTAVVKGNHISRGVNGSMLVADCFNMLIEGNWFDNLGATGVNGLVLKPDVGSSGILGLQIIGNKWAGSALPDDNTISCIVIDDTNAASWHSLSIVGNYARGKNASNGLKSFLNFATTSGTGLQTSGRFWVGFHSNTAHYMNAFWIGGRAPSAYGQNHIHTSTTAGSLLATTMYESGNSSLPSVSLAADFTNATTTLADTALTIPVLRNETWDFDAFLIVDGPTGDDIKITFTTPTSATLAWSAIGADTATTTTTASINDAVTTASGTTASYGLTGGTKIGIHIKGTITCDTSHDGALLLRAAQVSHSGTTTIYAGSYLKAARG